MKSWKTTISGVIGAALIIGYKIFSHQPVTIEDIGMAAGILGIGVAAKDNNVTGGTKPQ